MDSDKPALSAADRLAALQARRSAIRTEGDNVETFIKRKRAEDRSEDARMMRRDRSRLAQIIIYTYAAVVGGVVLYTLLADVLAIVVQCANSDGSECVAFLTERASQSEGLLNIITTAVLPIVTLMIGFYFGSEKAEARQEKP